MAGINAKLNCTNQKYKNEISGVCGDKTDIGEMFYGDTEKKVMDFCKMLIADREDIGFDLDVQVDGTYNQSLYRVKVGDGKMIYTYGYGPAEDVYECDNPKCDYEGDVPIRRQFSSPEEIPICPKCGYKQDCLMNEETYALKDIVSSYINSLRQRDEYELGHIKDKNGDVKPMKWLVLDKVGNKVLLVAKNVYEEKYYSSDYEDDWDNTLFKENFTWKTCMIRNYLNVKYYSEVFDECEKKMIVETVVDNNGKKSKRKNVKKNETKDKIFLLSVLEYEKYFVPGPDGVAFDDEGKAQKWWLRSITVEDGYENVAVVSDNGELSDYYEDADRYKYVRPAMWIDTSKL